MRSKGYREWQRVKNEQTQGVQAQGVSEKVAEKAGEGVK